MWRRIVNRFGCALDATQDQQIRPRAHSICLHFQPFSLLQKYVFVYVCCSAFPVHVLAADIYTPGSVPKVGYTKNREA